MIQIIRFAIKIRFIKDFIRSKSLTQTAICSICISSSSFTFNEVIRYEMHFSSSFFLKFMLNFDISGFILQK